MIRIIKKILYFPLAYYFRFWAQIQLSIWRPTIIVVTGSSGKTTLLHLIESQIQDKARYSHLANSSFGIPFDILGLKRTTLTFNEWPYLFLLAPFKAFKAIPNEKIYIVEADCDRPGEGKFLANLLKPEITLWISSSLTHSVNFDYLVRNRSFSSAEEAIAYEFGYFLEYTKKMAIVNGDSSLIKKQLTRTNAQILQISQISLKSYKILEDRTEFIIGDKKYSINFIVPKEVFYSLQMTFALLEYLKIEPDSTLSKFTLAPGRCNLFNGINNTTIIDSTYNATPDGVKSILEMFGKYPSKNKWIVLGDMIELGDEEKAEHEKLAVLINPMNLSKVILIGPRVSNYTYPKLSPPTGGTKHFVLPKEGLEYILQNIKGGETILFKGARFLEGIIEHLLFDKNDVKKLCRREKNWQLRRKKWGL